MMGCPNVLTVVILALTALACVALGGWAFDPLSISVVGVVGVLLSLSPRVIKEWERGVLLRLGKFRQVLAPGVTWVLLKVIDMVIGIRVSQEEEQKGLDVTQHGEAAYQS